IWDARTLKPLTEPLVHSAIVNSARFSPDGLRLATSTSDQKVRLWDVQTGKMLLSIPRAPFAFSPDGTKFAALQYQEIQSQDDRHVAGIRLWSIHSGRQVLTIPVSDLFNSLAFSPDSRTVVAFGSTVRFNVTQPKLWDAKTGLMLFPLKDCSSVHFSADGKLLTCDLKHVFSAKNGRPVRDLDPHTIALTPDGMTGLTWDGKQTFGLFEIGSGRLLHEFYDQYAGHPVASFNWDGRMLLIADDASDGKQTPIEVCDTKTWQKASIPAEDTVIDFDPNDFTVLVSREVANKATDPSLVKTELTVLELWDGRKGTFLHQLGQPYQRGEFSAGYDQIGAPIVVSPDGQLVAVAQEESLRLFGKDGSTLYSISGNHDASEAVGFSPDNQILATVIGPISEEGKHRHEVWNILNGTLTYTLATTDPDSIDFTPDGRFLTTVDGRSLDVRTGAEIQNKKESNEESVQEYLKLQEVPSIDATSADGKYIAVGYNSVISGRIEVYNMESKQQLYEPSDTELLHKLAFSPDGKMLAVVEGSGNAGFVYNSILNVATGELVTTFFKGNEQKAEMGNKSEFLAFSSDSRFAVLQGRCAHNPYDCDSGSETMRPVPAPVELRDAHDGKLIRQMGSGSARALSAAYTSDGKILVVGRDDASVNLFSPDSGTLIATLFSDSDRNWLVVTPDGLFDGSPSGWKQILWRFNNNTFDHASVEAFFKEYWRPGLLADIFAGKPIEPPNKDFSTIDIRQPQVRIATIDGQAAIEQKVGQPVKPAGTVNNRNIEIAIEVTDNAKARSRTDQPLSSGGKDLRLFRNGSLVKAWKGDIFNKQPDCELVPVKLNEPRRAVCKATVSFVAGENHFSAYAFNHEDVKSTDAELVATGSDSLKRAGTLYVLAVGVGENVNPAFKLDYAVKDAQGLSDAIKAQQQTINRYAKTDVKLLVNQQATKEDFLLELKRLSSLAQPEDGLLIYFSGHGTAEGKRFYMLPYDIGYLGARTKNAINQGNNLATILSHSISDEDLEQALRTADAGQIVMVIDACHSGQALNADDPRRGPMNSTGLAQLAYEKGMYILAASQDAEVAYESAALGHSYLTYALVVEGLKTKTTEVDTNKDGQIDLREWFDYASREVPRLREQKVEQLIAQNVNASSRGNTVRTKQLEEVQVAERGKVQTPRPFYRRELETQPFIVAKITANK
ncbi:MAG: caspase family protein, partial [Pyrinomonadaceae bacterium]